LIIIIDINIHREYELALDKSLYDTDYEYQNLFIVLSSILSDEKY